MAEFAGMVLTVLGQNLMARVQAGEQLNFTRIAYGNGVYEGDATPENLEQLEALINEMQSFETAFSFSPVGWRLRNRYDCDERGRHNRILDQRNRPFRL